MTRTIVLSAALAGLLAVPAVAQEQDDRTGDVQVKLLATAVLPDGSIKDVAVDEFGLPNGTDSAASDNYVPTLAAEYFISNNVSIETIAGTTLHDVDATAGLPAGTELVSDALLLPATVTAKYHFDLGRIKPYVGAGPAYFIWLEDSAGAGVRPLGITDVDLTDEFGAVLQAGFDVALGDKGLGLSFDAKRYFIGTNARFFAGDDLVIETEHRLDPWVISAGLSYRF